MEGCSNLIRLLKDGCMSAQSVEQITKSHIKHVLQELHPNPPVPTNLVSKQIELLLDSTQFLVKHNRNCFPQLNDVGFLDIIGDLLTIVIDQITEKNVSETWKAITEQMVDTVLSISDMSSQAKSTVVLQLLPSVLQILDKDGLTFLSRLEILKTINIILEQCHVQTKEDFLKSGENQDRIQSMIRLIQTVGDYEFQVGMVECLMRFFPRKSRKLYADKFMTEKHMHHGFLNIKDKDFETDCRHFLNVVNAKSEDPNQGVFSIPCSTVYLGSKELRKPSDINYNEFWVDFNIGSRRVTIFCEQDSVMSQNSNMDDDMWETVAIYKTDVQNCFCSVEEEDSVVILEIELKSSVGDIYPSQHQDVTDNKIKIEFDLDLEMHVTHAIAQTFRATEKVNKVSTVEQPLHISIKEVELSDSQTLASVPQTVSCRSESVVDLDACSQTSGSTTSRKHKISVPSIPMCSPLVKQAYGKDAKENSVNKSRRSGVPEVPAEVVKVREKSKKTAKRNNKTSKADFAVPKTPVIKPTRSKGKVKTPIVMVNQATRREHEKLKEKKKRKNNENQGDHLKPTEKSGEAEVIPDSLPVEDEGQTTVERLEQAPVPKVSTSMNITDDSGLGEDMSITLQETSLLNKHSSDLHKVDENIEEDKSEEVAPEPDNTEDNISTGKVDADDSGSEISDIVPETCDDLNVSDTINSSCKMQEMKKDNNAKIKHGMQDSFGFDALNQDIDSIPDSFDQHINETKSKEKKETKKKNRTKKSKEPCKKKDRQETDLVGNYQKQAKSTNVECAEKNMEPCKKKDSLATDIEGNCQTQVKSTIVECTELSKTSVEKAVKRTKSVSMGEELELLKELYDFELAEQTAMKEQDKHPVSNINSSKAQHETDTKIVKEKAGSKDSRKKIQQAKKQSKRTKDTQNSEVIKKEDKVLDKQDVSPRKFEKPLLDQSELPSRKSRRSNRKYPNYTELEESAFMEPESNDELTESENEDDQVDGKNDCEQDIEENFNVTATQDNEEAQTHDEKLNDLDSDVQKKLQIDKLVLASESGDNLKEDDRNHVNVDIESNKLFHSENSCFTDGTHHKIYKGKNKTRNKPMSRKLTHDKQDQINVKEKETRDSAKTQYGKLQHSKKTSNRYSNDLDDLDELETLSDSLYIEEDDSYNARRFRLDVPCPKLSTKKNRKSTANKMVDNGKCLQEGNFSDTNPASAEEEEEAEQSQSSAKYDKRKTSNSRPKQNSDEKTVKNISKKKETAGRTVSMSRTGSERTAGINKERVCVSVKGRLGIEEMDKGGHQFDQFDENAKCKSMVFQMSYSKSKTKYRSYDWAAETNVKKEVGYDPYDFEAQWDNASMQSERVKQLALKGQNKKESVNKKNKKMSKKTDSMNYSSDSETNEQSCMQTSKEICMEDKPVEDSLLVQDKATKKWYRKSKSPNEKTNDRKSHSERGKMAIKHVEQLPVESPSSPPDDTITNQEQDMGIEQDVMNLDEPLTVKSFSNIMKDFTKGTRHKEETMPYERFLQTPKSLQAMIDEVCDMDDSVCEVTKTPCINASAARTPNLGSCVRSKGYKPLNVCVIKTPQSIAISEKQDSESDDGSRRQSKKAVKRPPKRRKKTVSYLDESESVSDGDQSLEKSRTNVSCSLTDDNSLNQSRRSELSWIAERKKGATKKDHNKTYRGHKTKRVQSPRSEKEETDDDDESSSDNLEICSLTLPSNASMKSSCLVSAPVTPSCRKSQHSEVALDDLILSPITPYKYATSEDDIQLIQTQEKYNVSLTMDDADNLDFGEYNKFMPKNFNSLLGDSGFVSGPSSEVRPSRSTLKRKFPDVEMEESEVSSVDSDSQNEMDTSTFVPKKLFKSNIEDLFKTANTPKALSVYSDATEETDMDFPGQTGVSSFLATFGADIQKQFKAKRQHLEALTKDTLRATQRQFKQAWANQFQYQTKVHDDYMTKIMSELGEMSKDVDKLKEAELKAERDPSRVHRPGSAPDNDFYKHQLKVFQTNEQSQRVRMENMRKTTKDYMGGIGNIRKQNHKTQKSMIEQLKEGMANLQTKLLQDVQKQEMMNVKRGLQNMF